MYRFYQEICEALKGAEYSPLWVYGAHPSEESLKQAVEQQTMHLAWQGAHIASAVVLEESPTGWWLHLLYERLGFVPTGRRQEFQDFCGHVMLREYACAL